MSAVELSSPGGRADGQGRRCRVGKSGRAKPFVRFASPDYGRTPDGTVECRTVSDNMVAPALALTLLKREPRKANLRNAEPKLFQAGRSECLRESARPASGIRQPH
jgi:hypothetical protein